SPRPTSWGRARPSARRSTTSRTRPRPARCSSASRARRRPPSPACTAAPGAATAPRSCARSPPPCARPTERAPVFEVFATTSERLPLARVGAHAVRAEALGCDGLCVPEAVHDGLLAAAVALAATTRLRVATAVVVAFARSPMALAMAAWDLAEASGGRFELGLGPQVRGNVEGRYGVAWSAPA